MRTSVFPEGAQLEGEIRGAGDLVVRGTIVGTLDVDGTLTVEASGRIRGEVRARAMVVRGEVEGPVNVIELLRLETGARLLGDVVADRVSAASGSVVRGRVRMTGAERLKRTAGGTLTAPFTSSGQIPAPIVSPSIGPERPASIPVDLLVAAGLGHPHSIRERVTEVPGDVPVRALRRGRATEPHDEPAERSLAVRAVPIPPAPKTPRPAPLTPALDAPSPRAEPGDAARRAPVVPRLGRIKSRGRP